MIRHGLTRYWRLGAAVGVLSATLAFDLAPPGRVLAKAEANAVVGGVCYAWGDTYDCEEVTPTDCSQHANTCKPKAGETGQYCEGFRIHQPHTWWSDDCATDWDWGYENCGQTGEIHCSWSASCWNSRCDYNPNTFSYSCPPSTPGGGGGLGDAHSRYAPHGDEVPCNQG